MAKKKAFLLYTDMRDRMAMLTNDEAGLLFKAILDYAADKKPFATENRLLEYAFLEVKQQLERDDSKYEAIRCKRANAGAEGAKRRWEKARTAETPIAESEQSQDAKETDNTDTTGTATGADSKETSNDVPKGYEKFSFGFVSPELKEAFFKWLENRCGSKYKTQETLELVYKDLVNVSGGNKVKAMDVVNNALAKGYVGLYGTNNSTRLKSDNYATATIKEDYPMWERRDKERRPGQPIDTIINNE